MLFLDFFPFCPTLFCLGFCFVLLYPYISFPYIVLFPLFNGFSLCANMCIPASVCVFLLFFGFFFLFAHFVGHFLVCCFNLSLFIHLLLGDVFILMRERERTGEVGRTLGSIWMRGNDRGNIVCGKIILIFK